MEHKARRRQVPAFGEWNYYCPTSSPDEPPELAHRSAAAAEWWCSPEPEACSDAWFRYSPPPRKPAPGAKKARRPEKRLHCHYGGGKGVVAAPSAAAWVREPGAGAAVPRPPAKGGSRAVVRPVDEDLYQVPPPDFASSGRPPRRKRAGRSLWMGCLGGLGCIA